ncbi:hypothetical protein DYB35_000019 [Aphanomyces astaci]|uniref:Solute carrier family 40 member n=1 Tax=Aphanomyces astaci TaxID=112090 RepID=A0A3R6ZMN1_APHAT|nr:hypothetical protein DYB35_000019 [Aphanomyces astaci]
MWQFAVPLLLTRFFPTTLLPNVLFQLVVYIFLIVTMPHVGAFVDRTNRWHVIRTGIVGMTSMMVVSATALVSATVLHPNPNDIAPSNPVANTTTDATVQFAPIFAGTPWPLYTAVAVAVVASAVGQMFNDMQTLALEKDWVIELASATDTSLASWNTALLRIDMATRILSPMAFAFQMDVLQNVISYTGQVFVLVASVAGWNLLLAPLVLATGHDLYDLCPSLGNKKTHRQRYAQPPQTRSSTTAMWKLYLHHPTALVSLSFCLLYLTVLKDNALSTAYLLWHGTSAATVGWSMGSGAYCGVMASVVYPWLLQRWEYAETVAVASVWLYAAFLTPALFVVWWPGADNVVLMIVIATSQFWLWTTTLAETQIMQEWVQPHQRGMINAMQHTANKGFYVALLLLGVVFADPHSFRTLVLVSVVATTIAATGFSVWYCRHR